MEGAHAGTARARARRQVAEASPDWQALTASELAKRINVLDKQMYSHARNLEFEDAARLRDQIEAMRKQSLGLGS